MFRSILKLLFGEYCQKHDQYYKSDFCGQCVLTREARQQIHDERRIARSEGKWPLRRQP